MTIVHFVALALFGIVLFSVIAAPSEKRGACARIGVACSVVVVVALQAYLVVNGH